MWWKWVLQVAIAVGRSEWAKRKATELAAKLKKRAASRAEDVLKTVGEKVAAAAADSIIIREDRDTLRPGAVVVRDDRSYRVTKLLMVNKLGAFYEAKAE